MTAQGFYLPHGALEAPDAARPLYVSTTPKLPKQKSEEKGEVTDSDSQVRGGRYVGEDSSRLPKGRGRTD